MQDQNGEMRAQTSWMALEVFGRTSEKIDSHVPWATFLSSKAGLPTHREHCLLLTTCVCVNQTSLLGKANIV